MQMPQTTYRVVQTTNPQTHATQWHIVNEDLETLETLNDEQAAIDLCFSWLAPDEQAAMLDYWEDIKAAHYVREEQIRERRLLACDR